MVACHEEKCLNRTRSNATNGFQNFSSRNKSSSTVSGIVHFECMLQSGPIVPQELVLARVVIVRVLSLAAAFLRQALWQVVLLLLHSQDLYHR